MYSQPLNVAQAGPLIPDNGVMGDFGGSQASLSPRFIPGVSQEAASVQALPSSISHSQPDLQAMNHFGGSLYDPNDSALFNFDIAGLNFLNRYGALELGMLGHMSSGMAETPPNDSNTAIAADSASGGFPATVTTSSAYSASPGTSDPVFRPTELPLVDWQSTSARQTSLPQLHDTLPPAAEQQRRHDAYKPVIPNAYAIGAGLSSLAGASPTSLRQEVNAPGYDDGSGAAAFAAYSGHQQDHEQQPIYDGPGRFTQPPHPDGKQPGDNNLTLSTLQAQNSASRKRRLDASSIYKSVKQPYSYTTGFHSLTAFLQRRFSPQKTLRIAKALASIRPSFISCTKSLNRDDLVFMEKCFQRTLWEYEDFINAYGTPTIICRRTGEVAAVSKEFSLLTGWRRDVLLGKEPNLNVNTGGTPYSQQDAPGSRGGQSTPCPPNASIPAASEPDSSQSQQQLQPVFLAELLDDDSVIRFYEDFAKLAFGDSRGSVMAPCKLLSYRTKDDIECGTDGTQPDSNANSGHGRDASPLVNGGKDSGHRQGPSQPDASQGADRISSDSVMTALGKRDGKVDCMYCWTVKRDVFQVPMLIVMNVSGAPTSSGAFQSARANLACHSFFLAYSAGTGISRPVVRSEWRLNSFCSPGACSFPQNSNQAMPWRRLG